MINGSPCSLLDYGGCRGSFSVGVSTLAGVVTRLSDRLLNLFVIFLVLQFSLMLKFSCFAFCWDVTYMSLPVLLTIILIQFAAKIFLFWFLQGCYVGMCYLSFILIISSS